MTIKLQGGVSLADIRVLFDALFVSFPATERYLAQSADIVHSKDFENAVLKLLNEVHVSRLSFSEKLHRRKIIPITVVAEINAVLDDFAESDLRSKKQKKEEKVGWILPGFYPFLTLLNNHLAWQKIFCALKEKV